ncbi:hypothetical protein A0256_17620 [Mucilaginibacter sp. PAMC 26640]|nr:hypothetical protein A0256_17620 [Mucilaginibacter sp. PAMC 26640]
MLFIVTAMLSIFCLSKLNISYLPAQTTANQISILFSVADADPEQTETLATEPLENILSGINGIKKISSVSSYNSGRIVVTFESKSDFDYKYFEIISAVREARQHLSPRVSFPLVSKGEEMNTADKTPLLVYTIEFKKNSAETSNNVQLSIRQKLAAVPGIRRIELSGYDDQQLNIIYDQQKLQALQLRPESLVSAIRKNTTEFYPGLTNVGTYGQMAVRVFHPISSLLDIKNIPVVTLQAGLVHLGDLSNVYLGNKPAENIFRINGKKSINLSIYADDRKNQLEATVHIKQAILGIETAFDKNCSFVLTHDNSAYIRTELRENIIRSCFVVIILVILLFISYRDWQPLIILTGTLLINLGLLVLCCWFLRVEIHLYSLAGITIAFGIMIDHAIIIFDYFHQYKNIKSYTALLGATLTTIASLLLVFLLPDEEKKNLGDFSIIICLALGSSLLTNLFFTISLYKITYGSGWNRPAPGVVTEAQKVSMKAGRVYFILIKNTGRFKKTFLVAVTLLFGLPIFLLPDKLENSSLYNRTIGSDVYQQYLRPYLDKYTGGSLRLFKVNVFDGSGFRDAGKTKLVINAEIPPGKPIEQMDQLFIALENFLKPYEGIDKYISRIYSPQNGVMEIFFKKGFEHSDYPGRIKYLLTNKVIFYGGVTWSIYGSGQGFSNSMENQLPFFRIKLSGYDAGTLDRLVSDYGHLLSSNKRVGKVELNERYTYEDKPGQQYNFHINDSALTARNLNHADLNTALAWERDNPEISAINVDNTFYPLHFTASGTSTLTEWDLLHDPLLISNEKAIRFSGMGKITLDKTSGAIYKENRQYLRVVSFEYNGSANFGDRFLEKSMTNFKKSLPEGYFLERVNDSRTQKNDDAIYGTIVVLLIITNYIICCILFENLFQPLAIIFTIPVSFIGIFLTFYWFGISFDQGGYASFIMLGGLVANAGIFIINDYNMLQKKFPEENRNKLLTNAILNRFRTILLTSISAVCGLIPFLFQGNNEVFWFSFATGTIGGVACSFFSVFIFLPVMLWNRDGKRDVPDLSFKLQETRK